MELYRLTIHELRDLLDRREVSAEEVTRSLLERIRKWEPRIGAYLSVHEGPIGFSLRGTVPLQPGHILTLEPGYYEAGRYGFRTENVVLVVRDEERSKPGEEWLKLEALTLCPIDLALVERPLLTADEIAWLNAYHERVRKTLEPRLQPPVRKWLREATAAI